MMTLPPPLLQLQPGVEASSAIATTFTIIPKSPSSPHRRRRIRFSSSFFAPPWPQHVISSTSFSPLHCSLRGKGALELQVFAAKKKRKSGPPSSRDWSYEHLMVIWDEVFERCCCDPAKASRIRDLAVKGQRIHGRGCVFVFQEIQTIPRGSGSGFTSKPPRSSRTVPEFTTLDFSAYYLPREFLLDPLKAPLLSGDDDREEKDIYPPLKVAEMKGKNISNEMEEGMKLISDSEDNEEMCAENDIHLLQVIEYNEQDAASLLDDTSYNTTQRNDSLLVFDDDDKQEVSVLADTYDYLLSEEKPNEVIPFVEPEIEYFKPTTNATEPVNHSMDDTAIVYLDSKDKDYAVATEMEPMDLIDREKLFLAMKGMDVTRLLSLTTNFDFEAAKLGRGYRTSLINMKTMDAGGEDPYNPENGELVLLLHLIIDRRPTFGADVVIAHKHDILDPTGDDEENSWRLKLKYPI